MYQKIKTHIQDHQTIYTHVGVGVAAAGITCLIMRGRYEALALRGAYGLKTADTSVTMRPLSFLSHQTNVVEVVSRTGRGHPGYIVKCLDTGEFFRSQREAARAFSISETILSKHLAGKVTTAAGYTFERLPVLG